MNFAARLGCTPVGLRPPCVAPQTRITPTQQPRQESTYRSRNAVQTNRATAIRPSSWLRAKSPLSSGCLFKLPTTTERRSALIRHGRWAAPSPGFPQGSGHVHALPVLCSQNAILFRSRHKDKKSRKTGFRWCCRTGLNCRPPPYQRSARPLRWIRPVASCPSTRHQGPTWDINPATHVVNTPYR